MQGITSFEFIVGIAVGKILFGALVASPLFRSIALALGALAICLLYLSEGVTGILSLAHALRVDFVARPDFSKGLAVGAIVAFVVFGIYQKRVRP